MKNKFQVVLIIALFAGLASCKKPQSDIEYSRKYVKEINAARKSILFHMTKNAIPGMNVAVSIDGELVYSEGLGLASKDLDVKATRKTKFRIGEISSLYTNVLYHRLVEDGILKPDSSVHFYYPDFPEKDHPLKLSHLAHEISGLQPAYDKAEMKQINKSIQQGIDLIKYEPLEFPPGVLQNINCFNYNLLAAVMEKATGKKYRELLNEYLIDTLKLENTVIDHPFITVKGRSDFYETNIVTQVVNSTFYDLRVTAPSKGLLSNAEDLIKLGNAILSDDFLKEETRAHFFDPVPLFNDNPSRMANGWMLLKDINDEPYYGREGTVAGGTAAILIYPKNKMVIAYANNVTSNINDTPVFLIANAFLNKGEVEESNFQ